MATARAREERADSATCIAREAPQQSGVQKFRRASRAPNWAPSMTAIWLESAVKRGAATTLRGQLAGSSGMKGRACKGGGQEKAILFEVDGCRRLHRMLGGHDQHDDGVAQPCGEHFRARNVRGNGVFTL